MRSTQKARILVCVITFFSAGANAAWPGNQVWVMRYDNGFGDAAHTIDLDASGSVYVAGHSMSSSTAYDFATIKYDGATGVPRWNPVAASYNGPGSASDTIRAIVADPLGNVYATGESGGIVGPVGPLTLLDYATVKYDTTGSAAWMPMAARYNGPATELDIALAIAMDGIGDVCVTGTSTGVGTGWDYATLKYSGLTGLPIWTARYNAPGNVLDSGVAVAVDDAGDVYVTGISTGLNMDYATIKYNGANGAIRWVARYDGPVIPYRRLTGEFATASAVAAVWAADLTRQGKVPGALAGGESVDLDGRGILILGLGAYVTAMEVVSR